MYIKKGSLIKPPFSQVSWTIDHNSDCFSIIVKSSKFVSDNNVNNISHLKLSYQNISELIGEPTDTHFFDMFAMVSQGDSNYNTQETYSSRFIWQMIGRKLRFLSNQNSSVDQMINCRNVRRKPRGWHSSGGG